MRTKLDAIGVGLSGLCLVHCLLLPFFIILVPTLAASVIASEWTHVVLVACALPISAFAFWNGARCHARWFPALFGATGLALMVTGIFVPEGAHEEILLNEETVLTVIGATLLAIGHISNQRLRVALSH